MAWGYTGEAISCSFGATDFTNADFTGTNTGMTYLVALDASTTATTGAPLPVVRKTSAVTDIVYGVAVGIDGDGRRSNNIEGPRRVRVVRGGTVLIKKMTDAPAFTDIGGGVTGTTESGISAVSAANGVGRGTIVGITGTTTNDYLIVDLDVDPILHA